MSRRIRMAASLVAACALLSLSFVLPASETRIAVASNFTAAAKALQRDFERRYQHRLRISFGSTGKLFTQIYHGAPFEVLLAADAETPERAEREGLAVAGSRFTYAVGRLALLSGGRGTDATSAPLQQLKAGRYRRLAMANPKIAPYGVAAVEVMAEMALPRLTGKLVFGENIAQTHQFVATGNADLGFVALTQVAANPAAHYWTVPESYHRPIRQQAVLLTRGRSSAAAQAFVAYLAADEARAIIQSFGYGSP